MRTRCPLCKTRPHNMEVHLQTPKHLGRAGYLRMTEKGWVRSGWVSRSIRAIDPSLVEREYCERRSGQVAWSPRWACAVAEACVDRGARRAWLGWLNAVPEDRLVLSSLLALSDGQLGDDYIWLRRNWRDHFPHLPDPTRVLRHWRSWLNQALYLSRLPEPDTGVR